MTAAYDYQLRAFLADCPGNCGALARSIDKSLRQPRAAISLPAALSFFGTLKCGRIESSTGIAPNIFTLSIASSASGKTTAQHLVQKILHEAGMLETQLREPASTAGLLHALHKNPRSLMLWDECGYAIEALANNKDFKAGFLPLIMELYSSAGRFFKGPEYAMHSGKSRIDLMAPYLNIYGASTAVRFFEAINEKFVYDGLLPRWIIFLGEENPRFQEPVPFPYLEEWADIAKKLEAGNLGVDGLAIIKQQISIAEIEGASEWERRFNGYKYDAQTSDKLAENFWARGYENFVKLCLIVGDDPKVDRATTDYCGALIEFLIQSIIERIKGKIGIQSARAKAKEKFLALVKHDWISHSTLLRNSKRVDAELYQKKAWIEEAVEAGLWEETKDHADESSRKKSTFYKLSSKNSEIE